MEKERELWIDIVMLCWNKKPRPESQRKIWAQFWIAECEEKWTEDEDRWDSTEIMRLMDTTMVRLYSVRYEKCALYILSLVL